MVPTRADITKGMTDENRALRQEWFNYLHDRMGFLSRILSVFSSAPPKLSLGEFMPVGLAFKGRCLECGETFDRTLVVVPKFTFDHGFVYGLHSHYCKCSAPLLSISFHETRGILMPSLRYSCGVVSLQFYKEKERPCT